MNRNIFPLLRITWTLKCHLNYLSMFFRSRDIWFRSNSFKNSYSASCVRAPNFATPPLQLLISRRRCRSETSVVSSRGGWLFWACRTSRVDAVFQLSWPHREESVPFYLLLPSAVKTRVCVRLRRDVLYRTPRLLCVSKATVISRFLASSLYRANRNCVQL